MGNGISLGKIFGIPLRLHYTWFIIFALVTISLVLYFPGSYPLVERIIFGILTSILFFVSLIIHELAHSLVAIRNGIPVRGITLFVFGGVSQITKEATRPNTELLIAVVGPLSSLALAGIFYGLYSLLAGVQQLLAAGLAQWLAIINLFLALFNLIPGFPLDGGRVFRAIVWRRTHNYHRATRIATSAGRGIALAFIIGGVVIIFVTQLWFQGLWLMFIGWFLHTAAKTSYQQVLLHDALSGVAVRNVMDYGCPPISRTLSLKELVQNHILPTGRHCFAVAGEAVLEGMITLHDIKKIPRARWDITLVQDIMTPASKLKIAYPDQGALSALEKMNEENMNYLPVVEVGRVIGIVSRDDLNRFLRARADLGM
jgi:Zn-dependent protease/CBS domain-containing protein